MGQFGDAPRSDDYGFFAAAPRPTATTNAFGSGSTTSGQFGAPAPVRASVPSSAGGHVRQRRAGRSGRSRRMLPLVVAGVLVLAVGGAAWAHGMLPGLDGPGSDTPAATQPRASDYSVKAPKQLLGWTLSSGPRASQIDAAFKAGDGFGGLPVTTFRYTNAHHVATAYGGVVAAALTAKDQDAFLAGATSSLSTGTPGVSVGRFAAVHPGKLGGSLRCARLGSVPASTVCVFADRGSAGVVVVLSRSGPAAVDKARTVREAVVHRH